MERALGGRTKMITWADKVAFLGMTVETMPSEITGVDACYRYKVKVHYNPGCCSIGHGNTIDKAIEDAATSFRICWFSVEQKMTELEWERMSHT